MLEIDRINEVVVVRLRDSDCLNARIAEAVKEELAELFSTPNVRMIFDLKGITFIDSSGFSVFLSALKAANKNYGQFKLCNVTGEVMEFFELLQLHHVLEIYDQLDSCLSSFSP